MQKKSKENERMLRIYQREQDILSLGPGKRYCLWVQGCNRHCHGCISPLSQDLNGGYLMSPRAVAMEIALSAAEGVTISGGEPFLQSTELAEMLTDLKIMTGRETGVIIYTGYLLEELQKMEEAQPLLAMTDLLIDGPYIQELDDGKALRGSSNQGIHYLTPRYDRPEIRDMYGADRRVVQTIRHGFGITRVGVYNYDNTNIEEVYLL